MNDHYFSESPASAESTISIRLKLRDLDVGLRTSSGVFSPQRIDRGTSVLLQSDLLPKGPGALLDLGCGYGPVAVALALRHPDRHVWAVDINKRALQLTRQNASDNGVGNITACLPDEVPEDLCFGAIYSNPPIKVGKQVLHEMLDRWLVRMHSGSAAFLVVHKHLGSDSLARWLEEQTYRVARLSSSGGYRVLECIK